MQSSMLSLDRESAWLDRSTYASIISEIMSPIAFPERPLLGGQDLFAYNISRPLGSEGLLHNPVFCLPDPLQVMDDMGDDHVDNFLDPMTGIRIEAPAGTMQSPAAASSCLPVPTFTSQSAAAASEWTAPPRQSRTLPRSPANSGLRVHPPGNWRQADSFSGSSVSPVELSYTPASTQADNISPNGGSHLEFEEEEDAIYGGVSPTSTTRTDNSFVIVGHNHVAASNGRMSGQPQYPTPNSGALRGSPAAPPSSSSTATNLASQWGNVTAAATAGWMEGPGDSFNFGANTYPTAEQLDPEVYSNAGPFENAVAPDYSLPFRTMNEYNYDMVANAYQMRPQYQQPFPQLQHEHPHQHHHQPQQNYPSQLQLQHYGPTPEQQQQQQQQQAQAQYLAAQQQHRARHMREGPSPEQIQAHQQNPTTRTAPLDMGQVHMATFPMQLNTGSSRFLVEAVGTSSSTSSHRQSRLHPDGSQSSSESSSTRSRPSKKSFLPIVKAEPGSTPINMRQIPPQPVTGRRGGRQRGSNLIETARLKSSKMRKVAACWRCIIQRDPCDEGTPCGRCLMKSQKGQAYYFDCDRSKLPELVKEFLPPTMILMHEKQTIEDTVNDQVVEWNRQSGIDVYLTSGYGPPLVWKLYEFRPKSEELLGQLQYFQEPTTGRSKGWYKYSPPFGLLKLDGNDEAHVEDYLDRLMSEDSLLDLGWTFYEEETQVDPDAFQANLLDFICTLHRETEDEELRELLRQIIRMMIITYIMGHTLTILEETLPTVLSKLRFNPTNQPTTTMRHISPRLANRQLKFFFSTLRTNIYGKILQWQQQTFHTSGKKEGSWLTSFCAMLGFAMVLEEIQRTLQIQADAKVAKKEMGAELANAEACSACERIDERWKLLVGLFQCKYRDKKWTQGSFGQGTPQLHGRAENHFLKSLRKLLEDKANHLRKRQWVQCLPENQCLYTSRLVARFLIPFLELPP